MKTIFFLGLVCAQVAVLCDPGLKNSTLGLAEELSKLSDAEKFDFFSKNFAPKNCGFNYNFDSNVLVFPDMKIKNDNPDPLAFSLAFFLINFSQPKNYYSELEKYCACQRRWKIIKFLQKNRLKISLAGAIISTAIVFAGLAKKIFVWSALPQHQPEDQFFVDPDCCAQIRCELDEV